MIASTVDSFFKYLLEVKARRPQTIRCYRTDISQFSAHLEGQGKHLLNADADCVCSFLDSLPDPVQNRTRYRKFAALSSFYRWLALMNFGPNITTGIRVQQWRREPEVVTPEQLVALKQLAERGQLKRCNSLLKLRDMALIQVLCTTSIKISQLSVMTMSSRVWQIDKWHLRVKDGRLVSLDRVVACALSLYLDNRKANPAMTDDYLWINKDGQRLSERSMRRLTARCFAQVGINQVSSVRVLRNTIRQLAGETV